MRDWFWLMACGVISSLWCVTAARELSATYDEPGYLRLGLQRWRTGDDTELKHGGIMPLPVDVCTLPLYVAERWSGRPITSDIQFERLLPWARAANLVFWWLLLLYAWRIAGALGGPWAARLAVALLAVEPNFLAHAALATTDIAITACLLAVAFHFREGRSAGWWRRIAVPSVWFGLAMVAKASAILFAPLCLLTIEAGFLCRDGWPKLAQVARSLRHLLTIGIAGSLLASVYCGDSNGSVRRNLLATVERLPIETGKQTLRAVAQHTPLYIHAWDTVVKQAQRNVSGPDGVFLLGAWHEKSVWYYFPVALSIKLPVPLLLLPVLLALLRPRVLANWAVAAAAMLLLFSLTCRVQIGIRYMLPLVALGIAGLAAAVVHAWEALPALWPRRGLALWTAKLVAAMAVAAGDAWPNGLGYANRLWGGPERTYLLLSDSNCDWGQGLKELNRWQRRHHIERMDVVYFGADPMIHSLPLHPVCLPEYHPEVPGASRYVAVSTTALFGHAHSRMPAAIYLRGLTPVGRTSTFLIFELGTEPGLGLPPSAIVERRSAAQEKPRRGDRQ